MKNIKVIVCVLAACAALSGWAKAKKGNCAEKPLSLKGGQTAVLVDEWVPGEDGEKGEFMGTGAAYYKVTLTRGQAYTIWISGGDAEEIDFDVDVYWPEYDKDKYDEEKNEGKVPGAGFDIDEVEDGDTKVAYLYADDWDFEEDPKSGQYLVTLQGDIGARTTLNFTRGIRTFTKTGEAEAPKVISFSNSWKKFSSRTVEDAYYCRATLKAGRKYRVRTTGGTLASPLDLDVDDGSEDDDSSLEIQEDSAYAKDTNNTSLVVMPEVTGKYSIVVYGDVSQKFNLYYKAVPTRAIGSHPALPLLQENNYEVSFVPGRMTSSHDYYDNIIDEHLCKIYLVKGQRWVFETTGATQEQTMYVYDAKGKVLGSNESRGDDSYDSRVVVTASATGLYYVGVYDPALEVDDSPTGGLVTLSARNVEGFVLPDGFDPADDVYTGATPLMAYPTTTNEVSVIDVIASNDVAAAAIGAINGPHRLDANDLFDWFAMPCRAGFRYRLRAAFADEGEATTNLTLSAVAYYYASGSRKVAATTGETYGEITPITAANDQSDDFTFTAKANGIHYIRVSVAEGFGLEFPGYNLMAVVDNGTNELGLVKCDIEGGVGTWSYNEESAKYAGGSIVAVKPTDDNPYKTGTKISLSYSKYKGYTASGMPSGCTWDSKKGVLSGTPKASGTFKVTFKKTVTTNGKKSTKSATETLTISEKPIVRFTAASGYSVMPANILTNVPAWKPGDEPITLSARYSDIYDAPRNVTTTTVDKKTKKKKNVTTTYPADDTLDGAIALVPATAAKTVNRTLWADDPADHFSFTAVEGTYYNLAVTSVSSNLTLVVSNAVTGATWSGTPLADGTGSELPRQLLDAGKTFVVISHGGGEEKDAIYSLTFSKAATGYVRFTNAKSAATTSFSVKEGTEYATLYVARTGTEGAMSVRYATQAGTALPGTNYYPVTDGVVTWKAGDKAAKAIKIRMIPDLDAHWAASNLTFSVKLYPTDEYGLADGEYLTRTNALDTATVTIVETTAKKPGAISLASCDGVAVADVKKPAVTGSAGAPGATNVITLAFSRTGGADGPVAVTVSTLTAKGNTAKAGVDYVAKTETLRWEDGDDADKTFELELPAAAGYSATKAFTLTMAVVKTGFTPTLSAKTATVTVRNATVSQTAAAYAKTFGSAGLAFASTGTWFEDYDGTLRSAGAAGSTTFTLTGPGFFQCKPSLSGTADPEAAAPTLVCQVDKEAAVDCTVAGFSGIARMFASGKHTVKFTLAGGTGDVCVKFANEADGRPYLWVPLSGLAPADPMSKAVVSTNHSTLAWALPAGLAGRAGIYNRIRFGTNAKALSAIAHVDSATGEVVLPGSLAAGMTYYWAVDTAYSDATGLSEADIAALPFVNGMAWTFSAMVANAPFTVIGGGTDAASGNVADLVAKGESVVLLQGVKPSFKLDDDDGGDEDRLPATNFRLVGGTLPKGLSVDASTGALKGAPSTPGEYTALLQAFSKIGKTVSKKVNGKTKKVTTYTYTYGSTLPVTFKVVPAGTSLGSFRGTLVEDGGTFTNDAHGVGDVTLSVTSAGKLTAKVTIAGIAYTFTGTGYDEVLSYDDTAAGTTRRLEAILSNTFSITTTVSGKKKTTKYTNKMTVTMGDGDATNTVALAEKLGSVRIDNMKVLNAKKTAFTADVSYAGDLYRNNGGTQEGKAAMTDFEGYYTVALAPKDVKASDGVPVGNGYLLLTVAAANTVKVSGVLADGTAVSCSTIGQLVGDDIASQRECVLNVPVCVSKPGFGLVGVVQLAIPGGAPDALPVALPDSALVWVKSKAAATSSDGSGFTIALAPTGGWYDKVVNLQAYYLGKEFALYGAEAGEDLPAAALASGYSFSAASTPQDLAVKFTGNAISVAGRKLVKNNTLGLYDFVDGIVLDGNQVDLTTTSVNPWSVTVKFTRATGVLTGTLSAWEWKYRKLDDFGHYYPTAQKEIKKLAHKGVLLFSRDASSASPLDERALTAGFFLMPATTSTKAAVVNKAWKASLPFNILTVGETGESWDERDFGTEDP